jgi:molybdenum cofactor biosynthesis enzyme MoaA
LQAVEREIQEPPQAPRDLRELGRIGIEAALEAYGHGLRDGLALKDEDVAPVMIAVADTLITAFERDGQSQPAYDFLRVVSVEAAEVLAGFLQLANFPTGTEDPAGIRDPIILAYAGALSAARRHGEAIDLLTARYIGKPSHLPYAHALFVAQCRQAGKSDDLRGRFCPNPFEQLHVLSGGHVHLCCAAYMESVGSILQQDVNAVWNGPSAEAVRRSIHDGSYRYCNKMACPRFSAGLPLTAAIAAAIATAPSDANEVGALSRSRYSSDLKPIIERQQTWLGTPPRNLNLSFDMTCNLACPSCRTDFIAAKSAERKVMLAMTEDKIMPMLETARSVQITGSGDPFASKACRHILQSIDPSQCPDLELRLMTNGVLFTPAEWDKIAHLQSCIRDVRVSIDAARPETYDIVRRGGDWVRLQQNLEFLSGLLRQKKIKELVLAFVAQDLNWREMPEFVRMGKRLGVSFVYFQPIENWNTFSDEQYKKNAVHLKGHPDHKAFVAMLRTAPEFEDRIVLSGGFDNLIGSSNAALQ